MMLFITLYFIGKVFKGFKINVINLRHSFSSIYWLSVRLYLQSTKIILVPRKSDTILVHYQNTNFFQYCNSNIGLFSIAPHKVIALPTLRSQKLTYLTSLLHFLYRFCLLVHGFFSILLPVLLSLFNYCDIVTIRYRL